jgi:hypothetical protein
MKNQDYDQKQTYDYKFLKNKMYSKIEWSDP